MQKTKQKDHRPVSEQNNDPVQAQCADDNYDDLIALWCLRILVRPGTSALSKKTVLAVMKFYPC